MPPTLAQSRTLPPLELPASNRQSWQQDALRLQYPDPDHPGAWRAFVDTSVRLAERHVPASMAVPLCRFFSGGGPDALVLQNLPVDPELPAPPQDGKRPASKTPVSEAVIAGLIERYAAILAYSNEKGGAPIHEITPVAGQEHVPSSAGRVPFACHTDVAFLAPQFSPRGLLLFGLKNQQGAPTAVLPLERILELAHPSLVHSLEKPIFRHPAPASFEMTAAVIAPILWHDPEGIARIAVQTHAVQPLNEEARSAIARLRDLLDGVESDRIVLEPGHALLFRNDRVLHGRDAFTGERWLQRAYFTSSLANFRERAGGAPDAFVFEAERLVKNSCAATVYQS